MPVHLEEKVKMHKGFFFFSGQCGVQEHHNSIQSFKPKPIKLHAEICFSGNKDESEYSGFCNSQLLQTS